MAKKTENSMDAIKADLTQKFQIACVEMAAQMTFEIESAYESVIQSFYNDYTPRYYDRTYSTYQASSRYDDPFGFTPVEGGYESGIVVDHENIPGMPYRADKHWVFTRTFREGIHGFFRWEYKQWANKQLRKLNSKYVYSKKKKERMKEFFRKTMNHAPKRYRTPGSTHLIVTTKVDPGYGFERDFSSAKETGHSSASGGVKDMPEGTSLKSITQKGYTSTPEKGMNAAFRRITSKQNMDEMFGNILKKYMI